MQSYKITFKNGHYVIVSAWNYKQARKIAIKKIKALQGELND